MYSICVGSVFQTGVSVFMTVPFKIQFWALTRTMSNRSVTAFCKNIRTHYVNNFMQ